jgi:hypothetical protein
MIRSDRARRVRASAPLLVVALLVAGAFPASALSQVVPEHPAHEVFRLGGVEAPAHEAFSSEPRLAVAPDGRLFVRTANSPTIEVFDAAGRHQGSVGGAGQGPGEFQIVAAHGVIGDTLWAINFPDPRASRFRLDGTHLETQRLEALDFGRPLSAPQPVTALLRSGWGLAVPSAFPTGVDARVTLPVLLVGPGAGVRGGNPRTVAEIVAPAPLHVPGVGVFGLRPFPFSPIVAASGSGDGFAVARWTEADPGRLTVTRYAPDGAVRWTRELRLPAPPVPPAERAALLARGVEMAAPVIEQARRSGQVGRASTEAIVEAGLHIPEHQPPADEVVLGSDGAVWLGRPSTQGDAKAWLVLDQNGAPLFSVRLPAGATVRAATRSSAWLTFLGAYDVPYVARYDVTGPRSRRPPGR